MSPCSIGQYKIAPKIVPHWSETLGSRYQESHHYELKTTKNYRRDPPSLPHIGTYSRYECPSIDEQLTVTYDLLKTDKLSWRLTVGDKPGVHQARSEVAVGEGEKMGQDRNNRLVGTSVFPFREQNSPINGLKLLFNMSLGTLRAGRYPANATLAKWDRLFTF